MDLRIMNLRINKFALVRDILAFHREVAESLTKKLWLDTQVSSC
jgi:hypothetical protein